MIFQQKLTKNRKKFNFRKFFPKFYAKTSFLQSKIVKKYVSARCLGVKTTSGCEKHRFSKNSKNMFFLDAKLRGSEYSTVVRLGQKLLLYSIIYYKNQKQVEKFARHSKEKVGNRHFEKNFVVQKFPRKFTKIIRKN